MSRNRDLAAAFGVLIVAWALLGFATGFAARYYPEALLVEWGLGVLLLVFIPLVRGVARWTALGAGIVGIIWAVWAALGLVTLPTEAVHAPAVGLVFAALFAFFAFRAYLEKTPA